jgi:N-ethylmaleimide reductase
MSKQHLLTPYNKNINLKNRVVWHLWRGRADNEGNVPTDDLHGLYYEQRASAGLIITEGSQVSLDAIGYINTAGIHRWASRRLEKSN